MMLERFQSTSPYAGDDFANSRKFASFSDISIHVPLRGGRLIIPDPKKSDSEFQSTSPYAGDDLIDEGTLFANSRFQSTSPYAGDDAFGNYM